MRFISVLALALLPLLSGLCFARRINLLSLNHEEPSVNDFIPVYSSVDDFTRSLLARRQDQSNLLVIKPVEEELPNPEERNFEPVEPSTSSGRTFKHFLLLKSLIGGDSHSGGGGGGNSYGGHGGYYIPYYPFNITNINVNNVTNTPAAAAAAGGGAAGGGAAGASAPADGVRISYFGVPQTPSYPFQMPIQNMPMPTEVYHQRQVGHVPPAYTFPMMNGQGHMAFIPIPVPPYMGNEYTTQTNRRNGPIWSNNNGKKSPIMAFANSFKGLQFL